MPEPVRKYGTGFMIWELIRRKYIMDSIEKKGVKIVFFGAGRIGNIGWSSPDVWALLQKESLITMKLCGELCVTIS